METAPPTIGPTDRAVSMRTWLNIGLSGIDSVGTITCETLDNYIDSIISIDVEIIRVSDIEMSSQNDNLLLNIDVQGFELDVIRGIDWSRPPAYIVVEDYLNEASPIDNYLSARGYFYLCGRIDKVFVQA